MSSRISATGTNYGIFPSDPLLIGDGANLPFDNYGPVEGPICDVHWWGAEVEELMPCLNAPLQVQISFHPDVGGVPAPVPTCTYTVTPTRTDTGLVYAPAGYPSAYPLYRYDVDLDPCCVLPSGWTTIQGLGASPCFFVWLTSPLGDGANMLFDGGSFIPDVWDLAFCLTPGPGEGEGEGECKGDSHGPFTGPGTYPETRTGIVVDEGDEVTFSATGSWCWGGGIPAECPSADGTPGRPAPASCQCSLTAACSVSWPPVSARGHGSSWVRREPSPCLQDQAARLI